MERHMSELRGDLRLGHSDGHGRGMGQRNLKVKLMRSITSMEQTAWSKQHRRRHVGTSVGLPIAESLKSEKCSFKNVFGSKDAKVHRCTEPKAGKDF